MKENIKENVKENKKTNTKAQNDLSLLFKYRKFLMGFAALWILMTHEWQIVTNETSFFFVTENFIKRIGFWWCRHLFITIRNGIILFP